MSYRVDLPVFSGPMDLLLHLIRQHEVDIHDIPISVILDDYVKHLSVLQAMDLADIGDFVVMASTLMEIKSRQLLPNEGDEVKLEVELDPRDDLIQKLLEYKRFRDLSRRLERMSRRRARQLNPHVPLSPSARAEVDEDDASLDLELGDVDIWVLTGAFAKLLEETGQDASLHFGVERRDVRYWVGHLLQRLRGRSETRFEQLFERREGRMGLIGCFTAMLELMKQGFLRAMQEECLGEITVRFVGPEDTTVDDILPPEVMVELAERTDDDHEADGDASAD